MTNYIEVHKNRPDPLTGVIQWREDEVRPEWLGDDDLCLPLLSGQAAKDWKNAWRPAGMGWPWKVCAYTKIALLDDHWAADALKGGWRPWAGGDKAPDDYDGGEVLLWCGNETRTHKGAGSWRWQADRGSELRIIGYKPKPTKPEQVSPELVEKLHKVRGQISLAHSRLLAHAINWAGVSHARETEASEWAEETRQHLADFDAIMADMQPVDPLDELIKAADWLSVCAQTSGGTAGGDKRLMQAIDRYAAAKHGLTITKEAQP